MITMLTPDVINVFIIMVVAAFTIVIFDELINFIPDFMKSILKRLQDKNIATDNTELSHKYEENLIPKENKNLDGLSDLGKQYLKKGAK